MMNNAITQTMKNRATATRLLANENLVQKIKESLLIHVGLG